ncbi:MAG: hypothetical protein RLZZ630_854, partial [Bacteroidota bacterium]
MKLRKMTLIVVLAVVAAALLFIGWTNRVSADTEEQPYTLIRKWEGIEFRTYPPAILASVSKNGKMMEVGNTGFRELAGYIFGGNDRSEKIAMTAPVVFVPGDANSQLTEMSFVMPADKTMDKLPSPNSSTVRIHRSDTVHMAVLRFGGFANNSDIEDKAEELRQLLKKNKIRFTDRV